MELYQIRGCIKELLEEKRYYHSIGVEEVSHDLALIFGYDTVKASIAGILHDCAKYLTEDELIAECHRYHLPISEEEQQIPYILHAKVGAIYAKIKFGIEEEDILNAIRYHTTGRADMSILEKIVFIADFIEPGRKPIQNLQEIRVAAYEDLDYAVYLISRNILEYLQKKDAVIDSATYQTYIYYQKLIQ